MVPIKSIEFRIKKFKRKRELVRYLERSGDHAEELSFLKGHSISVFPYEWSLEYKSSDVDIKRDPDGYPYTNWKGKLLFGKKQWGDAWARKYFNTLFMEQDIRSAHCYVNEDKRKPDKGDVLADFGAAEGCFTLDYIDIIQKAYLFESDREWWEPLKRTFGDYLNRIEIVYQNIGGVNDSKRNIVTVDRYFMNKKIEYIKADIEGMEVDMLSGGKDTFNQKVNKIVICAYHNADDEKRIIEFLNRYRFEYEINAGFMSQWWHDDFREPYLRKGVIYGEKRLT